MILMEYKCQKCSGLTTVSKCCKEELTLLESGRVKCSKCKKFCKMEDCTECPIVEELKDEDQTREHAMIYGLLIFMAACVFLMYAYYKKA